MLEELDLTEATSARLRPVEWLNGYTDSEVDILALDQKERRAEYIHKTYGVLPTIGCEVEVKFSSLFPEEATYFFGEKNEYGEFTTKYAQLSPEKKAELDSLSRTFNNVLVPLYEATIQAGIPKGRDAFWEFANAPAYSWQTLAAELGSLMCYGLIPQDHDHSLHVTLGNVESGRGGMCLVLSGLELMHSNPQRLLVATESNRYGGSVAWARRGQEGIRNRTPADLKLGHTTAVELRTLTVSNSEQATEILKDAQVLAAILTAFRLRMHTKSSTIHEIAQQWPVFRDHLKQLWGDYNVPAESWGVPHRNKLPWQQWAQCIEHARKPESVEAKSVEVVKGFVSQTEAMLSELP